VIADLAMKTSVRVACGLLGLPEEEADWFAERINASFEREPGLQGLTERGVVAAGELAARLDELIAKARLQRASPGSVLEALLGCELEGEALDDDAVRGNLMLLLIGGTETLPKVFAAAVHRLAQHPQQRAALVADPRKARDAFQEALRYDMPTQALGRRVVREKVVQGQSLRPGQGVLYLWASGNRDEREFPDAERFDIERRAPRILSFGAGAHMCLGAHVARMEGEVMLQELLARVPEYRVLEDRAVRLRSEVFQGFASLPIAFEPA